jgi:hypothetical protein
VVVVSALLAELEQRFSERRFSESFLKRGVSSIALQGCLKTQQEVAIWVEAAAEEEAARWP